MPVSRRGDTLRAQPARRGQHGQVLVETAIVMPIMIFMTLGALQLMVMQHAQVMTEYSAYCAARAGVVNHANWNVMRNAAMLAALPLYARTDTLGRFAIAYASIEVLSELTELVDTAGGTLEEVVNDLLGVPIAGDFLPDMSLVEVDVTSPKESDFEAGLRWQQRDAARARELDPEGPLDYPERELDFDSRAMVLEHPRTVRLAVETRVLVPLRIPIVNWIFFQLWYAREDLRLARLGGDFIDWQNLEARVTAGTNRGKTLEEIVRDSDGRHIFDDALLTSQRTKEARMLRDLATGANVYLIPLRASYAMQMQSNPFYENRRAPIWFDIR